MASRALFAKAASSQRVVERAPAFAPRLRHTSAHPRVADVGHGVAWNFSEVSLFGESDGLRSAPALRSSSAQAGPQVVLANHRAPPSAEAKCHCRGACESCRQTQPSYSSSLLQVPEDSPAGTEDEDGTALEGAASTQQDGDGIVEGQGVQDGGDGSGGPLQVTPGSGGPLCHNGGGSSACDISSGEYKIQSNDNSCCTADCTQQHEAIHVADVTGWGCCRQASAAYTQSSNPGKVVEMYNKWLDQAKPLTECHAYKNDVKCATALQKTNDCNGRGKDSACCLSILSYKNKYSDEAAKYCKLAPAKAPPCPNFGLASVL